MACRFISTKPLSEFAVFENISSDHSTYCVMLVYMCTYRTLRISHDIGGTVEACNLVENYPEMAGQRKLQRRAVVNLSLTIGKPKQFALPCIKTNSIFWIMEMTWKYLMGIDFVFSTVSPNILSFWKWLINAYLRWEWAKGTIRLQPLVFTPKKKVYALNVHYITYRFWKNSFVICYTRHNIKPWWRSMQIFWVETFMP